MRWNVYKNDSIFWLSRSFKPTNQISTTATSRNMDDNDDTLVEPQGGRGYAIFISDNRAAGRLYAVYTNLEDAVQAIKRVRLTYYDGFIVPPSAAERYRLCCRNKDGRFYNENQFFGWGYHFNLPNEGNRVVCIWFQKTNVWSQGDGGEAGDDQGSLITLSPAQRRVLRYESEIDYVAMGQTEVGRYDAITKDFVFDDDSDDEDDE